MKSNKGLEWDDINIYLIPIGILTIILWFYQPFIALISLIGLGYLIYHSIKTRQRMNKQLKEYVEGLSDEFDSATKHAIFNMPFPLVMLNERGAISWYNTPFLKMMDERELLNEEISILIPDLGMDDIFKEDTDAIDVNYKERSYKVFPNLVDTKKTNSKNNMIVMLYWVDNTDQVNLQKKYKDEGLAVALVYVDNYDDVKKSTPEVNRLIGRAHV